MRECGFGHPAPDLVTIRRSAALRRVDSGVPILPAAAGASAPTRPVRTPRSTMTETTTLNRDTPTDNRDDKPAEPKRLLDLSATQLVGGALAAMTSAVVGAQLGVAGTILGAALGSIIAGVAGTLYTVSLKRTKDRIASAFVGRVGDTKVELTTLSEDAARALSLSKRPATGSGRGGTEDTVEVGGWDWDATATQPGGRRSPVPPAGSHRRLGRRVRQARRTTSLEAHPGQHGRRLPAGHRRYHRVRAGQRSGHLRRPGDHGHPGRRPWLGRF